MTCVVRQDVNALTLLGMISNDFAANALAFVLLAMMWMEHRNLLNMVKGLWPRGFTATVCVTRAPSASHAACSPCAAVGACCGLPPSSRTARPR